MTSEGWNWPPAGTSEAGLAAHILEGDATTLLAGAPAGIAVRGAHTLVPACMTLFSKRRARPFSTRPHHSNIDTEWLNH